MTLRHSEQKQGSSARHSVAKLTYEGINTQKYGGKEILESPEYSCGLMIENDSDVALTASKENSHAPEDTLTRKTTGGSSNEGVFVNTANSSSMMLFSDSAYRMNSGILIPERTSSLLNWPSCQEQLQT